jgi:hypothetical protein
VEVLRQQELEQGLVVEQEQGRADPLQDRLEVA